MCYKIQNIYIFGFTYASSEVHFRSTESQTFYWSIWTADDSIKCRCANSGMIGQVGGFQNPGVCLQAFPSFLPHPLPALLLTPFFVRCLTLVPRSFLLNRTETLATQANKFKAKDFLVGFYVTQCPATRFYCSLCSLKKNRYYSQVKFAWFDSVSLVL